MYLVTIASGTFVWTLEKYSEQQRQRYLSAYNVQDPELGTIGLEAVVRISEQ